MFSLKKMNIPTDGVLQTPKKMLGEECLIISIVGILPQSKDPSLELIHHHITLLEFMELISTSLMVLWRKELLPEPLFKDLLGEICHIYLKPLNL